MSHVLCLNDLNSFCYIFGESTGRQDNRQNITTLKEKSNTLYFNFKFKLKSKLIYMLSALPAQPTVQYQYLIS